jgi:ATP-dependent RNA helicase RhlE
LTEKLNAAQISTKAIHGNKSQGARTMALADFKSGEIRVLVATDVAARGIDINQLSHVVNYELPRSSTDYVHRIGRTGRAGRSGTAVSLISQEENNALRLIEKLIDTKITRGHVAGFE